MKFGTVKIQFNPTLEGYYPAVFAMREFEKLDLDLSGKNVLEIGPKHGIHTKMMAIHDPKHITCVELPSKKSVNNAWLHELDPTVVSIVYSDLLRFNTDEKFDVLLFCGVLYHNTEQLRLLKKLISLASEDALLLFESSTCRTKELMDKNLIEVHWPETFRNVPTIMFHPTKSACKSLLEIAGWDVIASSDSHSDIANPERIALLCRKSKRKLTTYDSSDVNHEIVND